MTLVPRVPFKGMPNIVRKWYDDGGSDPDTGRFVRFYASAGKYEDRFRTYWLVGAWVMLGYQGIAMVILTLHMAFEKVVSYPWVAHAIGTAVISAGYLVTACVYRFILFPHPGYLTSGHPAAAEPGADEQSKGAPV